MTLQKTQSMTSTFEAGLEKPSTVRLSRLVTVEKTILKLRIGRLQPDDLNGVRTLWNERFRL